MLALKKGTSFSDGSRIKSQWHQVKRLQGIFRRSDLSHVTLVGRAGGPGIRSPGLPAKVAREQQSATYL
jgi:hypothetical protein